jgi:hypothetical protein
MREVEDPDLGYDVEPFPYWQFQWQMRPTSRAGLLDGRRAHREPGRASQAPHAGQQTDLHDQGKDGVLMHTWPRPPGSSSLLIKYIRETGLRTQTASDPICEIEDSLLALTKTDEEPTPFTLVGHAADSPEPPLRPSPVTGHAAEIPDV